VQAVESPVESAPSGRRHPLDAVIANSARCADPRSTYTPLFFSENPSEAARAKAICARCTVRCLCLARALQRGEPFGVWGGEFIVDGEVVAVRRGRGRPRKIALPDTVDEITGEPVPAYVA
jgi:WhiB family redox-sensing transcriptional regulator